MLGEKNRRCRAFLVFVSRAKLLFPAHIARPFQGSCDTFRAHAASVLLFFFSTNVGGDKMFMWLGDLVSHILQWLWSDHYV